MQPAKVAIIEDEADILEVIEYNLIREGFQVCQATDGVTALRMVQKETPDLVLLDLMLPKVDGLEVCRQLKADPQTRSIPIIMVTAKGEESDIVLGLGIGADDYVTKPFSPNELVGRVKAVLRRGPLQEEMTPQDRIARGPVVVDSQRHEVKVDGKRVSFTPTEFRLLHFLASHPGRVFAREHILDKVSGEGVFIVDRNVDVHVRALRKKLGKHASLIETIRGVGYRFQDEGE
jgi:phosphate regulon transcriptional regulator PhoB